MCLYTLKVKKIHHIQSYSKFLFPFRVILIFLSHVSQINALALSSYNKIVVLYAPLLITTG
ncbi:hypothetical protein T4B_10865 [Trichinella pseudospiralis]|uniref:Uncharacterized protein n=1 Tax=Trichinella pseudospiralis TaxID=6337 RepID=A0A0V1H4H1_TRIPS|nr:hypothetical protein T4B_10865 [Trichinella pseudospiralis]